MIVIVGSSHDDILYFDKVLYNRKEELVFNRFPVAIGTIFNQEIAVVGEMYGSSVTSSVLTYLLGKYYVDLVISVGKCHAIDKKNINGDIAISTKIIDLNLDFSSEKDVALGIVPGFSREHIVQDDIIEYLKIGLRKRTYITSYNAVFCSCDNLSEETFNKLRNNRSIFGIKDENIVLDHNSSAMALTCELKDVPYVAIKVIENQFDVQNKVDNYLKVLDTYIDLGKAVVSTIGDIGRNDVLRS